MRPEEPPLRRRGFANIHGDHDDDAWLEAFRRGDPKVMDECYRRHHRTVAATIGTVLGLADRQTVVHEVFFRLLTEPRLRKAYRGPSLAAWLSAIGRNRALDFARRAQLEQPAPRTIDRTLGTEDDADDATGKRLLLERFRRQHMRPAWASVFETRFIHEMTQREAADHLGIRRTTLAYREQQLRCKLRELMQDS
jgi:RNA polymerase sigma-70 factor, ECF subfamily